MKKKNKGLFVKDKLLITIYKMSLKQGGPLKYEDVYVSTFKQYPSDFQLRGYPDYLDTELMSKKIYDLRKNGFLQIHRKFITITEKGKTLAEELSRDRAKHADKNDISKTLSRDITNQIDRIKNTDAYQLFAAGKQDQIVDTDFFAYLGTTVRTERTDFSARIKTVEDVIKTIKTNDEFKLIVDLHNYLFEKFNGVITTKLSIGYPRRNI
ncbi:MAG: hypothetical protein WC855_13200 [Thermodesulfovibrionales bacterium]